MKGDPVGPTFLTARDSIIAAANAGGGTAADIADIWAGFATRGLGTTASIQNPGSGTGDARVTESFLRPGDPTPTFTINDVTTAEGNAGNTNFVFTVSLANPTVGTSSVSDATANGTATSTSGSPVGSSSGAITLPNGAPWHHVWSRRNVSQTAGHRWRSRNNHEPGGSARWAHPHVPG